MLHDVVKGYNKNSAEFHVLYNSKKHITYLNNEDSQYKTKEYLPSHLIVLFLKMSCSARGHRALYTIKKH
jgi:hypothetical protein